MEDSGIDSGDPKPSMTANDDETFFNTIGSDSSCGSNSSPPRSITKDIQPTVVISNLGTNASTRQIQKKLEARIEHAKRKHRLQEYTKKSTQGLIPIQRLPIPGVKEQQQPLVDWESDDSEEDIVNFFPTNRNKDTHKQELTDTFSIEEMSISGADDDDDEEDDLNLVPPIPLRRTYECCFISVSSDKCSVM